MVTLKFVERIFVGFAKLIWWFTRLPFRILWRIAYGLYDSVVHEGFAEAAGILFWVIFVALSFGGSLGYGSNTWALTLTILPWLAFGMLMFIASDFFREEKLIHMLLLAVILQSIVFVGVAFFTVTPAQLDNARELIWLYCQITGGMAIAGEVLLVMIKWRYRPQPKREQCTI